MVRLPMSRGRADAQQGGPGGPAPARHGGPRAGGTRAPSLAAQLDRIEREGGDGVLRFPDDRTLPVSHLDRVVFPDPGLTKGDLLRYYVRIADAVVPALAGRGLVLTRHPAGVGGPAFHQHDPGDDAPDAVDVAMLPTADGTPARRLIGSLGSLLHAIQLGAVGVDAWHSRVTDPDAPDYMVLDLDPPATAAPDAPALLARALRDQLARMGRDAVLKTSGSRGLHLLVPLEPGAGYDDASAMAEEVATAVARVHPGIATVERAIANRPQGAVYVDHLQNARGKTLAAAFCARARVGAPISTPLAWTGLRSGSERESASIVTAVRRASPIVRAWRDAWDAATPIGAWRPGAVD
jgi:bifunctional non-homologous end joining protein LigD